MNSSQTISDFSAVLNFNPLLFELSLFICNQRSVSLPVHCLSDLITILGSQRLIISWALPNGELTNCF